MAVIEIRDKEPWPCNWMFQTIVIMLVFSSTRVGVQLQETFSTFKFDFLIHNAVTGQFALFFSSTVAEVDELINIHFKAGYFFTQQALRYLNDGGGIVNISSGLPRIIYRAILLIPQ